MFDQTDSPIERGPARWLAYLAIFIVALQGGTLAAVVVAACIATYEVIVSTQAAQGRRPNGLFYALAVLTGVVLAVLVLASWLGRYTSLQAVTPDAPEPVVIVDPFRQAAGTPAVDEQAFRACVADYAVRAKTTQGAEGATGFCRTLADSRSSTTAHEWAECMLPLVVDAESEGGIRAASLACTKR